MATMVAVWVNAVPALVASPNWNTWPLARRLPVATVVGGGHQADDLAAVVVPATVPWKPALPKAKTPPSLATSQ